MAYPMRVRFRKNSPLEALSHKLKPWVDYLILPVFAFASAGLSLGDVTLETFAHTLTLGIIFGLFFGKQIGIFVSTWILIKIGLASFPKEVKLIDLYGVSTIAGIGFTMALFVGKLSLPEYMQGEVRLGILCGSLLSALWGIAVFNWQEHHKKSLYSDLLTIAVPKHKC